MAGTGGGAAGEGRGTSAHTPPCRPCQRAHHHWVATCLATRLGEQHSEGRSANSAHADGVTRLPGDPRVNPNSSAQPTGPCPPRGRSSCPPTPPHPAATCHRPPRCPRNTSACGHRPFARRLPPASPAMPTLRALTILRCHLLTAPAPDPTIFPPATCPVSCHFPPLPRQSRATCCHWNVSLRTWGPVRPVPSTRRPGRCLAQTLGPAHRPRNEQTQQKLPPQCSQTSRGSAEEATARAPLGVTFAGVWSGSTGGRRVFHGAPPRAGPQAGGSRGEPPTARNRRHPAFQV